MDNASRALLISASVLLGVLLFGGLLYMRNSLGLFKNAEDEAKLIEQNSEFNSKFEAYNKSFMYGVDLVSLVGLVQNNNKKYYDEYSAQGNVVEAENFFIEVDIKLLDTNEGGEDLKDRVLKYSYDSAEKKFKYMGIDTTRASSNTVTAGSMLTIKR